MLTGRACTARHSSDSTLLVQVAGWVGIWVAFVAFYVATAILTGEVWNHVSYPCSVRPCERSVIAFCCKAFEELCDLGQGTPFSRTLT